MSHLKNMQAFGKLTGVCTGLGGTYNPGQQNLQANAMAAQLNIAQQVWEEVKEAQIAYDNATNKREQGFRSIRTLSSRVYAMLKSCTNNTLLVEDALKSKRRIWGAPISKPPVVETEKPEEVKPDTRPSFGQDFNSIAEYFVSLNPTCNATTR